MALRLRRGTDAERAAITFEEGELVYTTDTKEVFVGDGVTAGGINLVAQASGGGSLNNIVEDTSPQLGGQLDLNSFEINGFGDINIIGNINATGDIVGNNTNRVSQDTSPLLGGTLGLNNFGIDGIGNINITGTIDATDFVGNTFTGALDGDITGSVFADDSSVIVDSINKTISIDSINSVGNTLSINSGVGGSSFLNITSEDNPSIINLIEVSAGDLSGLSTANGRIVWTRDDINGLSTTSLIAGGEGFIGIAVDPAGTFADTTKFLFWTGDGLGIRKTSPAEALDVNGNAVVSGFVQFGSLTTAERDALTAANGMVIYNTTNNKFEGYQNGGWINLDDGEAAA